MLGSGVAGEVVPVPGRWCLCRGGARAGARAGEVCPCRGGGRVGEVARVGEVPAPGRWCLCRGGARAGEVAAPPGRCARAAADSDAPLAVLHAGDIAGAGLGVYDEEPLPAERPLRSAPRTVLTPHLGYVTDDSYRVFYGDAVEDIAGYAAGRPVRVRDA